MNMYNLSNLDTHQLNTITDNIKQRSQKFIDLKLNPQSLQALGEGSAAVSDFQEFLHFHNRDKNILDSIPFLGKTLRKNRYAKYTIDQAVDKLSEHLATIKSSVDSTLIWLRSSEEAAHRMLADAKVQIDQLKTTIDLNENDNRSRINQLESQGIMSQEDTRELRTLKQNLSILKGKHAAIETVYNAMEMKLALVNSSIDSTINIQGNVEKAQSLPVLLRLALETIQTNAVLQSAMGGIRDPEVLVRALLSDAVVSTNETSAEAQKLQQQAMDFKDLLGKVTSIKNDCEDITFKLS